MCARFQLTPSEDWLEELGLSTAPEVEARYNIAPSQPVVAVRERTRGRREAARLRWGLVPEWAEDPAVGSTMVNARAETLASRPAFREAFRARRCLVPATGFYEWRKVGRARDPYLIRLAQGRLFAFAGLWERWRGGPAPLESCAIVTTEANPLVARIHDRMPVLLDAAAYGRWLDPAASPEELQALLVPFAPEAMEMFPVSRRVNAVAVDDPDCARRVEEAPWPDQLTLW